MPLAGSEVYVPALRRILTTTSLINSHSKVTPAMNERDLFLAALDIADPEARRRFLDQACGGNVVLRASVDAPVHIA